MAEIAKACATKTESSQSKKVTLIFDEGEQRKTYELPVLSGTLGPKVIDIRELYSKTGYFTYDPGFTSTASCDSAITYIDGEKGILTHRGYKIEDLAEKCDFLEVAYLLLHKELPTQKQFADYHHEISMHTLLHEQLINFYKGFRRDAHPMAVMVGVVGALSAFYHDSLDLHDPDQRELASTRLIAKMPSMAAMAYKYSVGQPFVYPQNNLKYAENFLHMMFAVPTYDEANPYDAGEEYIPKESLETDVDKLGMHIDEGEIVDVDVTDRVLGHTPEDDRDDLDEEGYPKNDRV